MMNLNDLIDPSLGVTLSSGLGINDKGQIVAFGGPGPYPGGHVYLLDPLNSVTTPVPEPSTWALFGLFLPALLVWAHRHRSDLCSGAGQSIH